MKKAFLFFTILISLNLSASVWKDENVWSKEFEAQYSTWVKESLKRDIFSNPESKYYNIETDCADFIYATQVIFSFENSLPFTLTIDGKSLTNQIEKFDNLTNNIAKLRAFISYISDLVGSYNLAYKDSVSVNVSELQTGDFFTYKTTDSGQTIFHSYLIKEIEKNGNLKLIYSTTPKKTRKLLVRLGMPARPVTGKPFGFKRFKRDSIETDAVDNMQYDYVSSYGQDKAMKEFKKLIQSQLETRPEALYRKIFNMCNAMEARHLVVEDALIYKKKIDNRKMNGTEYYNYSTPSRDKILYGSIFELATFWKKIKRYDLEDEVKSEQLVEALDFLVGSYPSAKGSHLLKNICTSIKINYRAPIDFKLFATRYKKGKISSNPNHPRHTRWGNKL